jgi:Tfp pilus assembly protein FimT
MRQAHDIFRPRATHGPKRKNRRGYSLLEVLMTVIIIQIISSMAIVSVSNVQPTEQLAMAGQQMVVALRYARMLAMTSGQTAGVEFDTINNTVRVFQGDTQATAPNSLIAGGSYIINLNTQSEISGVMLGQALISQNTSSPYCVTFGKLGGTTNNGYVTLQYGGLSKTVSIPLVGEATVQ